MENFVEINTFGDSHSRIGFETLFKHNSSINSYSIYKFNIEYKNYLDIFNSFVNKSNNQILIICLGEIDARCLINKQILEKNREEDSIIKELVLTFKKNLLELFNNMENKKRIFIMSIVPTSKETDFGHEYNQRGTTIERKRYTEKLNMLLKEHVEDSGFTFFDIYDIYLNKETGSIKENLSDGVHITNREGLLEELVKYINKAYGI